MPEGLPVHRKQRPFSVERHRPKDAPVDVNYVRSAAGHRGDGRVQNEVRDGNGEKRRHASEQDASPFGRRDEQRVSCSQRRINNIDLERPETQRKNGQLPPPVTSPLCFRISDEQRQRAKQKSGAHRLVIGRAPRHNSHESRVGCPDHPRDKCRDPRSRNPPHNPRQQRDIQRHRRERRDPERIVVDSEQRLEEQEEAAFAPGPDRALRGGFKQTEQQSVRPGELANQPEPRKVVVDKPAVKPVLEDPEKKEDWRQPDERADCPVLPGRSRHLLSSDMAVAMTPSSRLSAPLGGRALSRSKSKVTLSFMSRSAGTSAVSVCTPAVPNESEFSFFPPDETVIVILPSF